MESIGTPWLWTAFFAIVLVMLAIDLFVVGGGKQHRVSFKEAATWSGIWVGVSLAFAGALWFYLDGAAGREVANAKSLEFITGYLIEKSLAIDNVFVWLMLFGFFAVPLELQKRVLLFGILGAIVMRTVMVFAGVWLIAQFHWLLYVFGAFLLVTGIKMWWFADEKPDLAKNPVINWLKGHLKITERLDGERFFVMREETIDGVTRAVRYATPLFLVLILVELSDLIFAVDSIPAIFAITTDPFIVLTSNVFAILGLRAMYFLLADMADRFSLLKYGLAIVLMFIGVKMLLIDLIKIPVAVSLGVVATIIAISIVLSLRRNRCEPASTKPVLNDSSN
ncbi:TerC family protein [Aromatoleum evansii]|uniref:TerC family protein n=1 Tax=Aromatoleum evansii TaxID=59406 RepID=A0ABZ1AL64_AROEV|nr:TerC family protein [Aromatoleum evansii]